MNQPTNGNTNCLAGMGCPSCSSPGPFDIVSNVQVTVTDHGVEDSHDYAWDDDSLCACRHCEFTGNVADFDLTNQQEEQS